MSKRTFLGVMVVALAVALTVGGLYASNMGFKLNYALNATGVGASKSGQSSLGLPFNRQTGLATGKNLMDDIGFASTQNVARFVESSDSFAAYTGRKGAGPDFTLVSGEANLVKMGATVNYIVVGSHDPSFSVALNATGAGSKSGQNFYSYPYHSTAATGKALMDDIGFASVQNVARFVKSSDSFAAYTGRKGAGPDFTLVPGEGYIVKMGATVNYIPSHY